MAEPVEFKIPLGWITLDVLAMMRWFRRDPAHLISLRFMKVFEDHGVKNTQIQRLIPEVTLDKVTDPMSLLPALTNEVLDKTAKLFGVQRAWLDGVTEEVYAHRSCYQDPKRFFEEFESLVAPKVRWHRLLAFCDDPKLDRKSAKRRTIVLVFVEHLSEWDDGDETVRYRPLTEPWYWDYGKSRIQLKAMLRAAYDHLDVKVVPLIKVDHQVLAALEEGKAVPPHEIKEREVSLEDYILSDAESRVAKETDELDRVMGYMQDLKMDEMAKKVATSETRPEGRGER